MKKIAYPFVPKSTAYLAAGQFWSIPLESGRFGCGRVIQLACEHGWQDRRLFLAGVVDWCGQEPPSAPAIAGRPVVKQGVAHIRAITEYGGQIIGCRPLEEDGIEPQLFRSQGAVAPDCMLMRGFAHLRPATLEEQERYPVFSIWGYAVARILAEKHCGTYVQTGDIGNRIDRGHR
ncbi:MAG: hypothetical protein JO250_06135 [Armatimonadetes bacterium]|nr:hypothetical protein [Armatimonadota bacterium]